MTSMSQPPTPATVNRLTEQAPMGPLSEPTRSTMLRRLPRKSPALRLSPTAWAKLLFLRDLGETEVGGFGITAADELLCVEDIQLVRQECTPVSVAFDDQAVADFFDRQVDMGRRPEQFGRTWVHTHPGNFPEPSMTDEETFARVFGRTDWAVMFILARGGRSYARLEFHVGPGGWLLLPIEVDFTRPFAAADQAAWKEEYLANVQEEFLPLALPRGRSHGQAALADFGNLDQPAGELEFWDNFFVEAVDSGPAGVSQHREGGFLNGDF